MGCALPPAMVEDTSIMIELQKIGTDWWVVFLNEYLFS